MVPKLMNIVSTVDVDGEHRLLLHSSGSQALSNQDFSVDKLNILGSSVCKSYLSLCLYICVIVFVSLHLRIFVFVYLPLN